MSTPKTARKTATFGMKVTPAQKRKIEELADRRGVTQTKAVMELVERELAEMEKPIEAKPGSFLEAAGDLVGAVDGPRDLATNPKYMEGYGR